MSAKISLPRTYHLIHRPRLFKLLDDAFSHPAVWIACPAGAGKTSLLAGYCAQVKNIPVWYQIDASDNDPAFFFTYMRRALEQATGKTCQLPEYSPHQFARLDEFAARYFLAWFENLPADSLVILDNYHAVDAAAALHRIMPEMLAKIPHRARVVVLSREQPPSTVARYLATRELQELGWPELRFNDDESRELLSIGSKAGEAMHDEIAQLAAGWPAALVLLAEHRPSLDKLPVHAENAQRVFQFIAIEIFDKLDAQSQSLLLSTAVFPSLTAAAAAEITGDANAQGLLESLYRRIGLIEKRTGKEISYTYHSLLREFLLDRLEREQPEKLGAMLLHAAQILERQGELDAAYAMYRQNGNAERTSAFIAARADSMLKAGRHASLGQWISCLQDDGHDIPGQLRYWLGESLLASDPSGALACYAESFDTAVKTESIDQQLLIAAGAIQAHYFDWTNFSGIDIWLARLEALLCQQPVFDDPELEAKVLSSALAGYIHRQPLHPLLAVCASRAFEALAARIDVNLQVTIASFLVSYFARTGETGLMERVVTIVRPLLDDSTLTPMNHAWFEAMACSRYYEFSAMPDEAMESMRRAIAIADQHGLTFLLDAFRMRELHILLSFGGQQKADVLLHTMNTPRRSVDAVDFSLARCRHALAAELFPAARRYAEDAFNLAAKIGVVSLEARSAGWLAIVCIIESDFLGAKQHIQCARERFAPIDSPMFEFSLQLIEAFLLHRHADEKAAAEKLSTCLAIGRKSLFATSLWWDAALMSELCGVALDCCIEEGYVRYLIKAQRLAPKGIPSERWPSPIKIYTLGKFKIYCDGVEIKSSGKPLEMLQAIIALDSEAVRPQDVKDYLWRGAEGDLQTNSFDTTLLRLRKLLGNSKAIMLKDGKLSLNRDLCWVDLWSFDHVVRAIEQSRQKGAASSDLVKLGAQLVNLYQGRFLASEPDDYDWQIGQRDDISHKFNLAGDLIASLMERDGDKQQAQRFRKEIAQRDRDTGSAGLLDT